MFLGLEGPAKDNVKFFEPTERALFIQEGPSSWRYYGLYVIQRHADNDLSKEEWEIARQLREILKVRVPNPAAAQTQSKPTPTMLR